MIFASGLTLYTPLSAIDIYAILKNNPDTMTLSYILDGRSALMLKNISILLQENPDKKILAITGNEHAKRFLRYAKDEKKWRKMCDFYQNVYAPIISPMEDFKKVLEKDRKIMDILFVS